MTTPKPYSSIEAHKYKGDSPVEPGRLMATVEALNAMKVALRNVRMYAITRRKKLPPEAVETLLRFCEEAGVRGELLRGTRE